MHIGGSLVLVINRFSETTLILLVLKKDKIYSKIDVGLKEVLLFKIEY